MRLRAARRLARGSGRAVRDARPRLSTSLPREALVSSPTSHDPMPSKFANTRSYAVTVLALAIVIGSPAAALAAPAQAAKKKKKEPFTATVSGTFTIKQTDPLGFGNDKGPNWQQITVKLKDAKVPFAKGWRASAAAKATATFEYRAEARTEDRSWHAGCDSEFRETTGTWTGKTSVSVSENATYLQTGGKSKRFGGWKVWVEMPKDGIPLVSKGSYNDWESILMTNCQTFEVDKPLGWWSTGFAQPHGVGKLASDRRAVPLLSINTEVDQTGSANGKLRFNQALR
jgi:hypothetical protein